MNPDAVVLTANQEKAAAELAAAFCRYGFPPIPVPAPTPAELTEDPARTPAATYRRAVEIRGAAASAVARIEEMQRLRDDPAAAGDPVRNRYEVRQAIRRLCTLSRAYAQAEIASGTDPDRYRTAAGVRANAEAARRAAFEASQAGRAAVESTRAERTEAALRDARADLRFLLSEGYEVEYRPAAPGQAASLRVSSPERMLLTHPTKAGEVDLGRFTVALKMGTVTVLTPSTHWPSYFGPAAASFVEVIPIDNVPFAAHAREDEGEPDNEGYGHPHLNGTAICIGDGGKPLARAIRDGRWADAFLTVFAVLREYNRVSPYRVLEHWMEDPGPQCKGCAKWLDPDDEPLAACDNPDCPNENGSSLCEECRHTPKSQAVGPCEEHRYCGRCIDNLPRSDDDPSLRECVCCESAPEEVASISATGRTPARTTAT